MGTGNANRSGGLDRPSPAKVIADLTKFADWEPADSPRAIAMRNAVLTLSQLAPRQAGQDPLIDPTLHAKNYSVEAHPATKEVRLAIFREGRVLGYLVLASPEIYDLGTELIKNYDKLEGIE